MKAVTFQGEKTVRFESVPDPKLEAPGDVVVKIELAGICGSDLHPYFGREKGLDPGTVMGHEAVGTVVEAGKGVARLRKGARVFSPFTTNCGRCFYCARGLTARCTTGQLFGWKSAGRGLNGLQAEYARIPLAESTLLEVPDGVKPEEALLLGDILSTGWFCAEMAGVGREGVYAIVGCGPVGVMAAIAARALGAARVFAVDPIPERRALAARYGATPIDPALAVDTIRAATDGRGADAVLEVVGNESAQRLALDLVRPGGTVAVAGVHSAPGFAFSPGEAYDKNLTYKVGRCSARHYMEKLAPFVQSRAVDFSPLFSHRLPLASGPEGYRLFAERAAGCTKVLLTASL
jgi:threonine dehydrogenase-like Zn-dependent dehydrogenase